MKENGKQLKKRKKALEKNKLGDQEEYIQSKNQRKLYTMKVRNRK